ncbi:MAG: hypothetical protein HQL49_04265 [Gammaproteobacteria bacterium]|nr:hypothetical protein [Gammaproteobacteria bacterium]
MRNTLSFLPLLRGVVLLFLLPLFLLVGCSPHPASGEWQVVAGSRMQGEHGANFDRLLVHYNGRAEIFAAQAAGGSELFRCFWAAAAVSSGATATASLNCKQASEPDNTYYYLLDITASQAALSRDGVVLGSWQKTATPIKD